MRDEQVQRYARAHPVARRRRPGPDRADGRDRAGRAARERARAELIAATYLAAGGVGKIVLRGATIEQTIEIEPTAATATPARRPAARSHCNPGLRGGRRGPRRRHHRAGVLARRARSGALDGRRRKPVTPIAIPAGVLDAIYAHAVAAFPDECCGYLVGAAPDIVDAAVACRNAQADGDHRSRRSAAPTPAS